VLLSDQSVIQMDLVLLFPYMGTSHKVIFLMWKSGCQGGQLTQGWKHIQVFSSSSFTSCLKFIA